MKKQRIIGIILFVVGAIAFLGASPYLSPERYLDGVSPVEIAVMIVSLLCFIIGGVLVLLTLKKK